MCALNIGKKNLKKNEISNLHVICKILHFQV
jgi:hypothetical protein